LSIGRLWELVIEQETNISLSHGNLPDEPLALSLDGGVDTHDFRPWHFEEIQDVMKAKAVARESNARIERRAVLAELAAYDQEIGI